MQAIHSAPGAGGVGLPQAVQPGEAAGVMQAAPPAIPGWRRRAGLGTAALITVGAAVLIPVATTAAAGAIGSLAVALSGFRVVKNALGAATVNQCRAGTLTGPQAQTVVGALRSPGAGLGTIAQQVVDNLPQGLSAQAAHAFLCGAHVVVPDNGILAGLHHPLPPGVSTRSSSHYAGAGQQYGCDIQIPPPGAGTAHLLFGPAGNGNMFFQLEKHGTGGVTNWLGHAMDYLTHKASGNAQVGPMGMVYASEKTQSELTVQGGQVMQRGQPV